MIFNEMSVYGPLDICIFDLIKSLIPIIKLAI